MNNKIDLDAHNVFWQELLNILRSYDDVKKEYPFRPPRDRNKLTESDIRRKLADMIKASLPGSSVSQNSSIWAGTGVKIDLYVDKGNDDVHIYELKAGTVKPLDVYQLLMYWDGVVNDKNFSPKLGRLVGKDMPSSVDVIITKLNTKKDSLGNLYKLEFKKYSDWGLSP